MNRKRIETGDVQPAIGQRKYLTAVFSSCKITTIEQGGLFRGSENSLLPSQVSVSKKCYPERVHTIFLYLVFIMFTERKRVLYLLLISILMNLGLFCISYFLNLPLWLDTTGTVYISCLLGASLGYIAAIINNIFEAVFFYGEDSLLFYLVSLITALVTGIIMSKYNKTRVKKWLILAGMLIIASGLSAVAITFIVNQGVPSNELSKQLYDYFRQNNYSHFLATSFAVLAIKIPDIIVTVLLVIIAIRVTPVKLKTTKMIIKENVGDNSIEN